MKPYNCSPAPPCFDLDQRQGDLYLATKELVLELSDIQCFMGSAIFHDKLLSFGDMSEDWMRYTAPM